ncbi:glyceraldehyde-3-phosphate dehydrogenase [Euryarchaeota archaeon SM23-78]|nr:MAG: glyceraldehyde-3-phosphate dehydrogenase [Euryarchaeota archaeon SM23-78]MBW3001293.1 type I glyceraldehyde-3-phosphate dehydrogenase [Candidatus Woesearchaeota archaeon]
MVRVAINGFGRIGRMVFRAGYNDPDIEWIAFNDLTDPKTLANLLKYDSVHGKFKGEVGYTDHSLIINGREIKVFAEKDPEKLPWRELNIDVVVESTGFFRTQELASKHLTAGAKKVLLSAPAKGEGEVKTIVLGVNEHAYDKQNDHLISNASCTTNCFAPVAKVFNDNYGINRGFMVTVHGYTADQRIVDGPHKDLRRARAAAVNIVPTSSGAAIAVEKVIPDLKGRLHSEAMRVPVLDGSIIYFVCELNKTPSAHEVNDLFRNVAQNHLKGILEYTDEPIVSTDVLGNPHSCIFDASLTEVDNNMLKVVAWYDNEWGYSWRMVDMIKLLL